MSSRLSEGIAHECALHAPAGAAGQLSGAVVLVGGGLAVEAGFAGQPAFGIVAKRVGLAIAVDEFAQAQCAVVAVLQGLSLRVDALDGLLHHRRIGRSGLGCEYL